jgi:hypothetical protein
VLLAPERVFKADAIAAEIIKRCTGEVTFSELIDDLAKAYTAPREKILRCCAVWSTKNSWKCDKEAS